MALANALVVFYSRTGCTKLVAETLAKALGADVERLVDTRGRAGLLGYLRSGFDGSLGRLTELKPLSRDPAAYRLVVVGTPVWNGSVSSPVRTFLAQSKAMLRQVAFFCTYRGSGNERTFRQMAGVCGKAPVATMAVRDSEVGDAMLHARIRGFLGRLHAPTAPYQPRPWISASRTALSSREAQSCRRRETDRRRPHGGRRTARCRESLRRSRSESAATVDP